VPRTATPGIPVPAQRVPGVRLGYGGAAGAQRDADVPVHGAELFQPGQADHEVGAIHEQPGHGASSGLVQEEQARDLPGTVVADPAGHLGGLEAERDVHHGVVTGLVGDRLAHALVGAGRADDLGPRRG